MSEPKGCGGFPRMQRRELELHDSKVRAVRLVDGEARLWLSAYVQVTAGEARTGWAQEIDLVIGGAGVVEALPEGGLWVVEGRVEIDQVAHLLLALPFAEAGAVRVELSGAEGRLVLTGRSVRTEERGEPRFVERLDDRQA